MNTTVIIIKTLIASDVNNRWNSLWKNEIPTAKEIEDCAIQLAWDWYVRGRDS